MLLSQLTWNLSGTSAFLISLSLLVNIPFSNSLGSNTWGDKMADWHSCFTIVDRSLIRERIQISASSYANADQSGADLIFPILFSIGTEWNGISNGSKFFIGQINRSHQILTYICQRLSKGWNHRSCYITDKNYIWQCLSRQKQSVNDWVFNAQTGSVRPSVYCRIVSCLSKMCIVSKKISDKCLHRRVLMEDNTRQHEEFLYRASLSER